MLHKCKVIEIWIFIGPCLCLCMRVGFRTSLLSIVLIIQESNFHSICLCQWICSYKIDDFIFWSYCTCILTYECYICPLLFLFSPSRIIFWGLWILLYIHLLHCIQLLMVCYSVLRTQFTYILCHGKASTLSQHKQGCCEQPRHAPFWKMLKGIYLGSRLTELLGHMAYVYNSDTINSKHFNVRSPLRLLPERFTSSHPSSQKYEYLYKTSCSYLALSFLIFLISV